MLNPIPGLQKPLRQCSLRDLTRHSENRSVQRSLACRKYSTGLMEEAYKLAQTRGPAEAARLSGINKKTLSNYMLAHRRRLGLVSPEKKVCKLTDEQKQQCWQLATDLHAHGFGDTRKCWREAGIRLGVSGRVIEMQIGDGIWAPTL